MSQLSLGLLSALSSQLHRSALIHLVDLDQRHTRCAADTGNDRRVHSRLQRDQNRCVLGREVWQRRCPELREQRRHIRSAAPRGVGREHGILIIDALVQLQTRRSERTRHPLRGQPRAQPANQDCFRAGAGHDETRNQNIVSCVHLRAARRQAPPRRRTVN